MTPAARIAAAIDILDAILEGAAAEKTLTTWARQNRYAGSSDRAAIRDHVFDALRQKRSLTWLSGSETGRGLMIGALRKAGTDPAEVFTAGSHLIGIGKQAIAANDEGYLTSVAHSPCLGYTIGLGYISRGSERNGERVRAVDLLRGKDVEVEICSPHFIDPQGERLRV